MNTHFKIMVPVYNCGDYVQNALISVLNQDYDNFECIVVDDCSTDNTANTITSFIEDNDCGDYFTFIENPQRMGICYNHYNMIQTMDADDDDVLITLDGDDWLANNDVLKNLDGIYQDDEDVWLTYGSYVEYPTGRSSNFHIGEYSPIVKTTGTLRTDDGWKARQLRTFKYFLAKRIEKEDLLDEDGSFYETVSYTHLRAHET